MVPICDHQNNTIPTNHVGWALQIPTRMGSSSFAMLEIATCNACYMDAVARQHLQRHDGCGVATADGVVDIRVST